MVVTLTNRDSRCKMNGSYFVVQNSSFSDRLVLDGPGPFAVRASTFANGPAKGGGAISVHSGNTVLIEGNSITDWGPMPSDLDQQGISLPASLNGVWVLSNVINRVSGDSIMFCHGCVGGTHDGPANVYIAGNEMNESEENALDFKEFVGPLVVVCNSMSGYRPGQYSGNGEAVRVNDEGQQGELWMSKNEYSNNMTDIAPYSSDALGYYLDEIGVENLNDNDRSNTQAYVSGAAAQPYYDLYQQQYGLNLGAACQSASDAIFDDDFESGDTTPWSNRVPQSPN